MPLSKEPAFAVAHMLHDDEPYPSNNAAKERDNAVAMTRVKPIKQDISELSSHFSRSTNLNNNNKKTHSIELPNRQQIIVDGDGDGREFNRTDYV